MVLRRIFGSKEDEVRREWRKLHDKELNDSDGKPHNQIDHILRDRRWNSRILVVRSFKGSDPH